MNQKIKDDILNILSQATGFLEARDAASLNDISNYTTHNASIFQDKDSVTIAVIMYALSKIIDRIRLIEPDVMDCLKNAKDALAADDMGRYEEELKSLIDKISQVDKKMDLYIQHIINDAGIRKGSRLYEHGISIAQTADIFGISQWELIKYIGQTNIAEQFGDEVDIKTRLVRARELFDIHKD